MQCWSWLLAQLEYRQKFNDEQRREGKEIFEAYEREAVIIKRLMRLVEVVQILGAQFTALLKRNETLIKSNPPAQAAPASTPTDGEEDGEGQERV